MFVIGFWICVTRDRSLRSLLPGALTAAVLWQILQLVGTAYVDLRGRADGRVGR